MGIALFLTCEACNAATVVQQNCDYETKNNRIYQVNRKIEIDRGCWHVCIDDKLKEHGAI